MAHEKHKILKILKSDKEITKFKIGKWFICVLEYGW